ncbi:MAG: HIT domain-containing protein [Motiliproteus sp.]
MNDRELVYLQDHELDPDLHPFELHPQLQQDTILLGHFILCDLLLMNDATYPWFIMVPRRSDVGEIYHLSEQDQSQLIKESSILSTGLNDTYTAEKMNVAALGNKVRQLHIHHVVRFSNDPAWPEPVWGKVPTLPYSAEQVGEVRSRVNGLLKDEDDYDPV